MTTKHAETALFNIKTSLKVASEYYRKQFDKYLKLAFLE